MNERYNLNATKLLQVMSMQEHGGYSMNNSNNANSDNYHMSVNRSNYSFEDLTNNVQNISMNSYAGGEFMPNNRLMYMSNNEKLPSNIKSQSHLERPGMVNKFGGLNNGPKVQSQVFNTDQRLYGNTVGFGSLHPQVSNIQNSNVNHTKSISHFQKGITSDVQQTMGPSNSTMFFTSGNVKQLSQQQIDNELQNPKWIVFPPVHESALQLRQGKQHLTNNRLDNPLFVNDELRKMYLARISSCLISASTKNGTKIPDCVNNYTDITPLESIFEIRKSKTFNQPSICYKAFDKSTNEYVLFRRFPSLQLSSNYEKKISETFCDIHHSGIISIKEAFLTKAFEDNSTVFIMDFLPCCATALQAHVSDVGKLLGYSAPFNVTQQARPYSSKKVSDLNCLPEERTWCYLIQIINIIRYIHNILGLSCRLLDPSKILIQYPNRIKLNCFGVLDVLSDERSFSLYENPANLLSLQTNDLKNLGQLMMCLICGTAASLQESDFSVAVELLQKNYSSNMKNIILRLFSGEFETINDVAACTFAECYNHISLLYDHIDYLEYNLMKELECGRLFRLVCKLGTICERNELGMDSNWSDYGPNYQLKLFRDFVFHQVDADGHPYLDLAHIVTSLNKLDSGSEDSICLISRDQKNMFCVTFSDLKKVMDDSFEQLLSAQKIQPNVN